MNGNRYLLSGYKKRFAQRGRHGEKEFALIHVPKKG
jgi:hypothetical protein